MGAGFNVKFPSWFVTNVACKVEEFLRNTLQKKGLLSQVMSVGAWALYHFVSGLNKRIN